MAIGEYNQELTVRVMFKIFLPKLHEPMTIFLFNQSTRANGLGTRLCFYRKEIMYILNKYMIDVIHFVSYKHDNTQPRTQSLFMTP
jgi:hypothetical protein